jgi:predicted NBD/HSP70 family sugar kinase
MREGISRAELARVTGLQKSTVSVIVDHLLGIGWVQESAVQAIKYGRHPKLLTINERLAALAVDLRPSRAVLSAVDFRGRIINKSSVILPSDAFVALKNLGEAIKSLMQAHPEVGFQGLGISVPGRIDRQSGMLAFAPNLPWSQLDLARRLAEQIELPIAMGNAADAIVLAEQWFANFRGVGDAVVVTVSEGIGTGVLSGGRLLEGWHGMAGEFGHVVLEENGPKCGCGKHGCWEIFASNRAAERYDAAASKKRVALRNYDAILAAAHDGEPAATATIEQQFRQVGRGLRFILPFAPEVILIVGEMVSLWKEFGAIISEEIKRHNLGGHTPRLMVASDGEMERLRGAAALILQRVYSQGTRVLAPVPQQHSSQ